jgi:hypothetical protein
MIAYAGARQAHAQAPDPLALSVFSTSPLLRSRLRAAQQGAG